MKTPKNELSVLVTGGSGFVGIHCLAQLLHQGYTVKTTLRNMQRRQEVLDMLAVAGITHDNNISFYACDLMKDDNWADAIQGCTYVLHVASPISLAVPTDEQDTIRPAVEGTLRVLRIARDAGVKRVVLTSSFGAVGYSHRDSNTPITEACWTDPNDKHLSAYLRSKVLAERAAWDFIKQEGGALELAVINPMAIFGPTLGRDMSSGFELLKRILDGSLKAIPNIVLGIVDVRDVADLHLRAMVHPDANGQRFLALAGGTMTLPEVAVLLKRELGAAAQKVSTRTMPDWIVRIAAWFNEGARNVAPQLGQRKNASNEKARTWLHWKPRTNKEAILAAAESMVAFDLIA
jgi:nucleoside-diphosphate-sugar epimerase